MDVAKLKVVELRAELANRGLDQKGNKPVLVARLQEALDSEQQGSPEDNVPLATTKDEEDDGVQAKSPADEASAPSNAGSEQDRDNQEEDSSQFVSYQEESESKPGESEVNDDSNEQVAEESSEPPFRDEESHGSGAAAVDDNSVQSALGYDSSSDQAPIIADSAQPVDSVEEDKNEPTFDQNSSSNYKEPESMDEWNKPESNSTDAVQPSFHLEDSNAQDATIRVSEETEQSQDPIKEEPPKEDIPMDFTPSDTPIKPKTEEIGENGVEEKKPATGTEPRERRRNRWADADPVPMEAEQVQPLQDSSQPEDVKPPADVTKEQPRWGGTEEKEHSRGNRKRERSPDRRQISPQRRPDNEPYFDEKDVLLSWYDSDLHMIIDKDNFFSATLINSDGFGYVWAGVRATYGFEKGKVFYEVKATEFLDVSSLEDEPNPHVLRVGWSVIDTSLQLGEESLSYGYGATGKISSNCKFQDYGKPFTKGDVIGCYVDLDAEPITMTFTVNGEDQGVAYKIEPEEGKGKALFPHILSKNCAFHVNFGEQEPWAKPPLPEYTYVGNVPVSDRVPGPKRPVKREECEVIMMVGLPGSGKTTWALKYASENKDKMFNILGTNTLIDKMKVMGLPRRRNYSGRWEGLISKCTRCLNTLLEIGGHRRRNYILDQTNVYPTAQRRKMRGFDGFKKRAVVVVPTDDDLKARTAKREAEEGKDVPDSAVLEMKANFLLPEKDIFNSVEFVELKEEEAATLVKQYNKEGNDAGYESKFQYNKRPRTEESRGDRDRGERSDRSRSSGSAGGGGGGGGGFHRGGGGGGFGGRGGGRGGFDRGGRNSGFGDRGFNDRSRGGFNEPRGFGDRGGGGFGDHRGGFGERGGYRGDRSGGGGWRDRGGFNSRPRNDDRGSWGNSRGGGGGGGGGSSWRDSRGPSGGSGASNNWGSNNRFGNNKEDRNNRGRSDDRPDKDNKRAPAANTPATWNQSQNFAQPQNSTPQQQQQQQQQQGWQAYGQQWGNWGQGYNAQQQGQQQWKGYGQQMNQGWGQQGWANQNWANWNQQYYNQAYQQNWGQQASATTGTGTDASQAAAFNYGAGGAAIGQAASPWPGYSAVGSGTTGTQQGVTPSTAATFTPSQK